MFCKSPNMRNKCPEWECLWSHVASGTVVQGKQCSQCHLPVSQGRRWIVGTGGGGWGGNSALIKHMEKQTFPLPAAVSEGKCQHAPRPRLTVPYSAPPPGSPCSATEYGQQWHCGACPPGSLNDPLMPIQTLSKHTSGKKKELQTRIVSLMKIIRKGKDFCAINDVIWNKLKYQINELPN